MTGLGKIDEEIITCKNVSRAVFRLNRIRSEKHEYVRTVGVTLIGVGEARAITNKITQPPYSVRHFETAGHRIN